MADDATMVFVFYLLRDAKSGRIPDLAETQAIDLQLGDENQLRWYSPLNINPPPSFRVDDTLAAEGVILNSPRADVSPDDAADVVDGFKKEYCSVSSARSRAARSVGSSRGVAMLKGLFVN